MEGRALSERLQLFANLSVLSISTVPQVSENGTFSIYFNHKTQAG